MIQKDTIEALHLKKILEFSTLINSTLQIKQIIARAIEASMALTDSEAGSLLLYDEEKEELYFDVALGEKADQVKTIRLKLGEGIAGWVALHRRAEIINNVQEDPRFYRGADKKSGFITRSMITLPVTSKDHLLGVLQVLNKKSGEYTHYDLHLLFALSSQIAVALENAKLYQQLKDMFYETIFALADTIEKRDPYTGGHTKRVMEYSYAIGKKLNLPEEELEKLKLAAILHDIGKIGIRDEILLKTSSLSNEEYEIIKKHTLYGADILKNIKKLKDIIPGVRNHHERYDGKGYPDGLSGEHIPLIARIIAVADTYDAMTTTRPYRPGLKPSVAIAELKVKAGTQFDPQVVEAFIKAVAEGDLILDEN